MLTIKDIIELGEIGDDSIPLVPYKNCCHFSVPISYPFTITSAVSATSLILRIFNPHFLNRCVLLLFHHPIPPSTAPAISATSARGTRIYFPSGRNQPPIFFSRPAFTAFSANSLSAIQKNIIAASIAPSGQI